MLNLKKGITGKIFSESTWHSIIDNIAISLGLSENEKQKLSLSPVAKLLAALPYYAHCKNPDQLAVLKIGMYIISCKNSDFFAHRDDQSIRERILPVTYCPGDTQISDLIITFLELISINDHLVDFDEDMKTGHPNPISTNILYYYSRKEQLIREMDSYPDQKLVRQLIRIADPIKCDWWGY